MMRSSPRRGLRLQVRVQHRFWSCETARARQCSLMLCGPNWVDEKGFSVDAFVSDVKWLGYNKVTLKSGNEPAIVKLLQEALREF